MFVRNLLLAVGILSLLAGLVLSVVWIRQIGTSPPAPAEAVRQSVLVASHAVGTGTLLRPDDVAWKDIGARDIRAGTLLRGQIDEKEFVGAIARRDFAAGEPLTASDFVRPSERQFLAAALKPGMRAVSIAVDAPQSAAGLILPGDQVDIILAQSFPDTSAEANRRTVAETVLRDVRVIAIDQTLSTTRGAAAAPARPGIGPAESRTPRTVTFELTEAQAERLVVAAQLGRIQLSVRPLEIGPATVEAKREGPTWAADVSPALNELAQRKPIPTAAPAAGVAPGIESTIRRPPTATDMP